MWTRWIARRIADPFSGRDPLTAASCPWRRIRHAALDASNQPRQTVKGELNPIRRSGCWQLYVSGRVLAGSHSKRSCDTKDR